MIPILFAGNIMNVFALQTPYPSEQLEDKEKENTRAQLGSWIKTGLIRSSAKDRQMSCVSVYIFFFRNLLKRLQLRKIWALSVPTS